MIDVLGIGLVEHRQHVVGDTVEVVVELGPRVHRPGRVVRVTDVDELRPRPDCLEHRAQVVAVLAKRHPAGDGTELQCVDGVARERRPAAHDLVARIERELREIVDDAVRARTRRDLLEAHVVPLSESSAQSVRASVRVPVELGREPRQGVESLRKRAVWALVRSELDHTLEAELALDLLDRLARLVGHEVSHRGLEETVGDLGQRGHGGNSIQCVAGSTLPAPFLPSYCDCTESESGASRGSVQASSLPYPGLGRRSRYNGRGAPDSDSCSRSRAIRIAST